MTGLLLTLLLTGSALAEDATVSEPAVADAPEDDGSVSDEAETSRPTVELDLAGLIGERPVGIARAGVVFQSDASLSLSARLHGDGRVLGRMTGALDVLGGGSAHLTIGAFGGAVRPAGKPSVLAQGGGQIGLGYDDARFGLGYQARVGLTGFEARDLLVEHEVTGLWNVSERFAITGSWLRVSDGSPPEDLFGAGVRVRF